MARKIQLITCSRSWSSCAPELRKPTVNHLHTEILYDTEDIRAAVDKAMGSPASNPPNFPLPPFPTCLHAEKLYMYTAKKFDECLLTI